MVDRPNRDTLDKAIVIYRGSMRAFLVKRLSKFPDQKLEEAVGSALEGNPKRKERFDLHIDGGGSVNDFIDISDFYHLINKHWDSVFDDWFAEDKEILTLTNAVNNARNKEFHPPTEDLDVAESKYYLFAISSALKRIGREEEQHRVDQLKDQYPGGDDTPSVALAQLTPTQL